MPKPSAVNSKRMQNSQPARASKLPKTSRSKTLAPATPPSLSRAQRYEHRSAEKAARDVASAMIAISESVTEDFPLAAIAARETPQRVAKDNANKKIAAIFPPPIPLAEVVESSPDGSLVRHPSTGYDDCSDDRDGDYVGVASSEDADEQPPLPPLFLCAASRYCECTIQPQLDECVLCINCNRLAHEQCVEPLLFQVPCEISSALSVNDLEKDGKKRLSRMSKDAAMNVSVCILCKNKLQVMKAHGGIVPVAPRKKSSSAKSVVPRKLIRELQRLAAFQCQIYIFTTVEKIGKEERERRVREQFYGNAEKRIKGVCEQIVDGDHAFKQLYDTIDGNNGPELHLRSICCGKNGLGGYVAGIDFTAETLTRYSNGKTYAGKSIWDMGLEVHKSLKKALSLLPRLSDIVTLDRTGMVQSFASGKNEKNLYDALLDGMYAMEVREKKKSSDGINNGTLLDSDVEVDTTSTIAATGDIAVDDSVEDELNNVPPKGYMFYGFHSFVCFGPLTTHFSATLALGAPLALSPSERKNNARAAQRKKEIECREAERSVGAERGLSLQSKLTMGMLAQKEEDSAREERQMNFLALSKELDATQKLLDVNILIAEKTNASPESSLWSKIGALSTKVESLLGELQNLRKANASVAGTNQIVLYPLGSQRLERTTVPPTTKTKT